MNYINVTLTAGVWTNLNTASGIAAGAAVFVKNLGNTLVRFQQAASEPTGEVGDILTPMSRAYAHKDVPAGGAAIWVKADYACEVVIGEVV